MPARRGARGAASLHRRGRDGEHAGDRRPRAAGGLRRRLDAAEPRVDRARRIPSLPRSCVRRCRDGCRRQPQTGGIAMIDRKSLLFDLRRQLKRLEQDLAERAESDPVMADALEAEYRAAREAERTGDTFRAWCSGALTQAAVAWLLGCVFVRFAEDNALIETALIAGPGERNARARGSADALLSRPPDRLGPRLPARRLRRSREPARNGAALRPQAQPGVALRHLRRRGARPAGVLARGGPGYGRAPPRLHGPRMGHPLPRRPVPGTSPTTRRSASPCCKPRSSSRSSSWTAP